MEHKVEILRDLGRHVCLTVQDHDHRFRAPQLRTLQERRDNRAKVAAVDVLRVGSRRQRYDDTAPPQRLGEGRPERRR